MLATVALLVGEGDLVVVEFEDAVVAEGHAKDIGRQILQGGSTCADGSAVHHPILGPGIRGYFSKEVSLLQGIAKLGSKENGERLGMDEEVLAGREPGLAIKRQSAARDQTMQMGMVSQVPSPGLQDGDHADFAAYEARILRQLLQGCCSAAEEQIVDAPLMAACDCLKLGRQCEGDHEVGDWQEEALLFL